MTLLHILQHIMTITPLLCMNAVNHDLVKILDPAKINSPHVGGSGTGFAEWTWVCFSPLVGFTPAKVLPLQRNLNTSFSSETATTETRNHLWFHFFYFSCQKTTVKFKFQGLCSWQGPVSIYWIIQILLNMCKHPWLIAQGHLKGRACLPAVGSVHTAGHRVGSLGCGKTP